LEALGRTASCSRTPRLRHAQGDTLAFAEGTSSFLGHPMRSPFQRSAFRGALRREGPIDDGNRPLDLTASFTGGHSAAFTPERAVLARSPPSACMAYERRNQKDSTRRRSIGHKRVTHVPGRLTVSPMFPVAPCGCSQPMPRTLSDKGVQHGGRAAGSAMPPWSPLFLELVPRAIDDPVPVACVR
jgi:hypothetical protein